MGLTYSLDFLQLPCFDLATAALERSTLISRTVIDGVLDLMTWQDSDADGVLLSDRTMLSAYFRVHGMFFLVALTSETILCLFCG